ncbi:MAG TPA: hypothetical protein VFR24_27275 [Candidatus Angelobacter sp.]|nr:hypothetical protein [Candidatus Angelobacter sp.]
MPKKDDEPKRKLTPSEAKRLKKEREEKIAFANKVKEALLFLLTRKL